MTMPSGPIPAGMRRILVRDLVMPCSIGVHAYEHRAKQRIRLNLVLDVAEAREPIEDRLHNVVDYNVIISAVRETIGGEHVRLIETLAESIADVCLTDSRVHSVRVTLEKLDVYDDVGSVGIVLDRHRSSRFGA